MVETMPRKSRKTPTIRESIIVLFFKKDTEREEKA